MTKKPQYFQVMTTATGDTADLYLYGMIGQDYWYDSQLKDESLTDLAVVKKIKELESQVSRINIRINSPGGSVYHGGPIISAILESTAEVHTYIDGIAASMAANIWAVGHIRHANSNSKLMIHNVSAVAMGNALDMMTVAEQLEAFDASAIASFAEATGMTEDEVRAKFYDYKDHWLTANDLVELGFVAKIDQYPAKAELPQNVEQMAYNDIVKFFTQQDNDNIEPHSLLQQLRDKIFSRAKRQTPAPDIVQPQNSDMKIEEFNQSLGGDLPVDAVAEALRQQGFTVEKTADPATPEPAAAAAEPVQDITQAVAAAVAPLFQKIESLEGQIKQLGDMPGAQVTDVATDTDGPDGIDTTDTYDALKALASSANKRERVDAR
jgi:ATP-dependent Clp protease, protease subunit